MFRSTLVAALALAAPIAIYSHHASVKAAGPAQAPAKTGAPAAQKKAMEPAAKKSTVTDAQKIANAETAAPPDIARHAAIMDWPDTPNGKMKQLRAGTNGWMCLPNSPVDYVGAPSADPMCVDKSWQTWMEAFVGNSTPKLTAPGIGYMLHGDKGASNTDPTAKAPTATNQWVVAPEHVMVLFPDTKMLDGFSADPKNGGPWVMWKGSPYAHLMVPVSKTKGVSILVPKK